MPASPPRGRSRTSRLPLLGVVLACGITGLPGALDAAATTAPSDPCVRTTADAPDGLPDGGPPALYCPEPTLPDPQSWRFEDGFPRTSATGRYLGGAYFWSDWLYDDTGATGVPTPDSARRQPTSLGTYTYPESEPGRQRYAGNGADIFRTAFGLDGKDTWWRVDWNTLVDRTAPIAEFVFDTDRDTTTGTADWPGNAGVSSPGIETALLVSGHGAWLIDARTGRRTNVTDLGGALSVDMASRSFLVRVPRQALQPAGRWTVRMAAGLANATGDAFLQLTPDHGAAPGQPNVFNVGFRALNDDESAQGGNWFDGAQNSALTTGGDVSRFSAVVDWSRLADRTTEPEPRPTGLINRWHVSRHEFGQGVAYGEMPTYRGRVQPYLLYVPSSPLPDGRYPLTWHLHGRGENHNSSPSVQPRFLRQLCEERTSLCASPSGRDPAGFWRGAMNLDMFEVWNSVAADYPLAPERTVLGGVSMGAIGSYPILLDHPHLFAAAYFKSGSAKYPPFAMPLFPSLTAEQTNSIPRLSNARWNPVHAWHGMLDELVPYTDARETYDELKRLGYRYVFDQYPAEDHVAPALKDSYDAIPAFLRQQGSVKEDPGLINYQWVPRDVNPALGIGPHGAWWVQGVTACGPDGYATVVARSGMRPEPSVKPMVTTTALPDAEPTPAIREQLTWTAGPTPPTTATLTLTLDNVAHVRLAMARAGFRTGSAGTIEAAADCASTLTLTELRPGTPVSVDSAILTRAGADGQATVWIQPGEHTITFG